MSVTRRDCIVGGLAAAGWAASPARAAASGPVRQDQPLEKTTDWAVNVEMWWTKLPFLDRLRAAADAGFKAVEFWPWHGKDIDAIAKLREELGLQIAQFTAWGFSPGLNDPANHADFVAKVEEGCAVAKRIGAKMMTVVGGNDREGVSQADMHAAITDGLKLAAPIAEANDVMLILEPMNIRVDHPGHCLYGSPPAVAICRAVDSTHVKINWDLYHMQITEGDLCGRLREGRDQLGYVQLADHPGRTEPGTGEVQYARVLRELWKLEYKGLVGLECRPRDTEDEAVRRVRACEAEALAG